MRRRTRAPPSGSSANENNKRPLQSRSPKKVPTSPPTMVVVPPKSTPPREIEIITPPHTPRATPKPTKRKATSKLKQPATKLKVKSEPPEIDFSKALRPPSPTDDPLLLSGGWDDDEFNLTGDYTGKYKVLRVPTKTDPPTSEWRESWGRPVSPYPYSEDDPCVPEDPPTVADEAEEDHASDDDEDVEGDVIKVTSGDAKAAARAAAILRMHDYDCFLAAESKNHTKSSRTRRRTIENAGVPKPFTDSMHPWKCLDKCLTAERLAISALHGDNTNLLASIEDISKDSVLERFITQLGGESVLAGLGPDWSRPNLIMRLDVLIKKQSRYATKTSLCPKRLVDLRHLSPSKFKRERSSSSTRLLTRRSSSGFSVRDLVRQFEELDKSLS